MADLAVVIVTWNVRALVLDALRSLYVDLDSEGLEADVYVVDNDSTDGTAEAVRGAFPQVRLLEPGENLGFVRGNNLALREIGFGQGRPLPNAVYLLNPDTVTQPGATRRLYEHVTAGDAGLTGPRLTYGDGSFQHAAFAFPGLRQTWADLFPTPGRLLEGRFNGRYPRALYERREPFGVDFVLGAAMMLRGEAVAQVGLFDEAFFMYCEEIDLAWRLHEAGWPVRCVPAAHIVHLGGQSTQQARPSSFIHLWTSRLRLYEKHWPPWKLRLGKLLIRAGMRRRLRQAQALPQKEREGLVTAYREVHRLALSK